MFYIYCNERNQLWKPHSMGYTSNISEAGQYSEVEARQICNQANIVKEEELMIDVCDTNNHLLQNL